MAAALLLAWPRPSIAQEVPTAARDAVTEAADLKRDGRLADAERRLGEAIQQAPAYDEAWWLNAWVQLGLQDDAAALLAFRKAARLLPADDPRVAQAVAQADALAAVGVALPQPAPAAPAVPAVLPQAPARPAPLPVGHPWAGWPAALLFLAAALSCGTAWLALRADARHGPAGPHAQFALLARRLARGETIPATRALQLVLDPALAHLPEDDRVAVLAAAAAGHPPSRAELANLVHRESGPAQRLAALALSRQQEQPAPELWTALLDSPDPTLRGAALRGLGQAPDPAAVVPLALLARSPEPGEALLAVTALGRLGDESAQLALAALPLADAVPAAASAAVAALAAKRRLPAALAEPLGKLLDAAQSPTRPLVAKALAATGEAGTPRLLDALLDPDPEVRTAAMTGLSTPTVTAAQVTGWAKRLADQPATATVEALRWLSRAAPAASGAVLERVLQEARATAETRLTAIALLAEHPAEGAASVLLRGFQRLAPTPHPAADERALAEALAGALAQRGVTAALAPLLEWACLQPGHPCWLRAAKDLASRPEAGEALATAVGEPASKIRRLAVALLADCPHPAAADALLAELSRAGTAQTAPEVLRDAAAALGALGDRRALEPLRTLLQRHPELADDRLDVALAQLGDEAARSRVEAMLLRPKPTLRRPAASYFRGLQPIPPRAAAVVAEADAHAAARVLLDGPADPVPGLVALGEAVVPTLRDWLADPAARLEAAAALARLGEPGAQSLARQLDRIDTLLAGEDAPHAALRSLLTAEPAAADYARAKLGEARWLALTTPESEPS